MRKNSGFTLVEMLVAIAVFMIVMTVAVGSLMSIIDANRKAQAIKNVVNNINFALESISKDMRVGTNYSCLVGVTWGDCVNGGDEVKYTLNKDSDSDGNKDFIHYRFVSGNNLGEMGNIQKCVFLSDNGSCPNNKWDSLTAPTYNVQITNMKFYVIGSGTTNLALSSKRQPRVVITLEGTAGSKDNIKTSFNIQTTVSQRIREIQN